MATTTLPLFWHLSSSSRKDRIDASVKLISALEQFQSKFEPKASPVGSAEDEDEEMAGDSETGDLDALNAQDVSYSIRRLVRGLASPRESSRLGFAVALTELLSRINSVTCSQIVTLIQDGTKLQGAMTGQEERDVLFARLFGLTAVVQSGLCVRAGSLTTSASSSTEISSASNYSDVISQLVLLGEKKSWLRESAWFTISLAIDAIHDAVVSWKEQAINEVLLLLFPKQEPWSPEKVALVLKLQKLYPNITWDSYLVPPFKNANLLSSGNLAAVARILKESAADEEVDKDLPKTTNGSWKPQLHFVWDSLLDQLLLGPNSTTTNNGSFQDFFRVVVDESLFASTSSPERKYWGFQVFQKALKRVTKDSMPMLFTKNFMRSWINHLSHRDRYLHKIAQQTATEVQSFVQENPQLGFSLILQLTGVHGSHQFDKLTKTKTVETILTTLDLDGIKNYITNLFLQANEPEYVEKSDVQAINSRRSWIIEQLGALIRNGGIPKDDEWIQSVLDWLIIHGLFIVKKKSPKSPFRSLHSVPRPAFSDDLRKACRNRLLGCLSDLNTQTTVIKSGEKNTKASGVSVDGEFWVANVLSTIRQLKDDQKHVSLVVQPEEEVEQLLVKAQELASKLKQVTGEQHESAKGTELLLLGTTLHHYCSIDEDEIDVEPLEACIDGALRLFFADEKPNKKSVSATDETPDEPVDVFVDTIIGFLEKSTAYMRSIGNQVFSLLSGSAKGSTIDLIVTQLERRDPTQEDDDEEEVEGEGDDDEDDDAGRSSEAQTSNSDIETEDSEEINEAEDLELRNKIEEALRVNGIEPATGETDEEEEELMDDDEMMAIDEQLAQVFRSRANEKKSGKDVDAQREATHFKNRVLDLVDIYLKKQPTSLYVIRFILPLLEIIAGSSQDERQLSDKAKGILRSRLGKGKEAPSISQLEPVTDIVTSLHSKARKASSSDILAIISLCSCFLTKIFMVNENSETIIDIYRQSLGDFMTRKNSSLNTAFFQDVLQRYPRLGWGLRNDLLVHSKKAVNPYRRAQAFHLLEVLLTNIQVTDTNATEFITFVPLLREALHTAVSEACGETATFNTAQIKQLLKSTQIAIRQTQRFTSSPIETSELWQPQTWKSLHTTLAGSQRFKASVALQKLCEQIEKAAQAGKESTKPESVQPTPKRKAEVVMNGEEDTGPTPEETRKVKRKKVRANK